MTLRGAALRKGSIGLLNFKSFDLGLKKVEEEIEESFFLAVKKVALEAFTSLVLLTPVDTGRARNAWTIAFDVPDTSEEGGKNLPNRKTYRVIWINNQVPYITALEEGTSQQAPQGMLTVTANKLARKYKGGLSL